MKALTDRQRFERWAARAKYSTLRNYRDGRQLDGYYQYTTQHAWLGWKAANKATKAGKK